MVRVAIKHFYLVLIVFCSQRAEEMGHLFVVFVLYTPRVISTNPDDVQVYLHIAKHTSLIMRRSLFA